ncbi:hypothetical protein, partial [Lysobacter antibioticus]|uniref:hypothetical protein n=1 Tax=Lysobacter antibioticus TaxID=84531 RepID=UPI001C94F925
FAATPVRRGDGRPRAAPAVAAAQLFGPVQRSFKALSRRTLTSCSARRGAVRFVLGAVSVHRELLHAQHQRRTVAAMRARYTAISSADDRSMRPIKSQP